ncbi:MAG: hypothetical protein KDA38_17885, partial [Planctomycetales bacterium]|nr:hypothetical protein [Planctomycetales bacterium]
MLPALEETLGSRRCSPCDLVEQRAQASAFGGVYGLEKSDPPRQVTAKVRMGYAILRLGAVPNAIGKYCLE